MEHGFVQHPDLISPTLAIRIIDELTHCHRGQNKRRGGLRNANKKLPSVAKLIKSDAILAVINAALPEPTCQPLRVVRAIVFDKSANNNWRVGWHQDKTIAVSQPIDAEGWGPWTIKEGVHHVQPPAHLLQNMVTLRIHLDPVTRDNGCLMVIPNSHQHGLLNEQDRQDLLAQVPTASQTLTDSPASHTIHHCEGPVGSALIMSPLLLHASAKAINQQPRRILHIEYSRVTLPAGLDWA